jgi:hypothetical protein
MALLTRTGYGTPDITSGTQVFDFSPVILANLRMEEAFLAHIDVGDPIKDTVFYWQEDALNANQVTQSGTLATTATTLNVAAGQGKRVLVGAILQALNTTAGTTVQNDNGEQVQVTAIATDALTITRAYGLTADPGATYPASTIWKIMTRQTLPENSALGTDTSLARLIRYNFTQIFERTVNVSRNQIKRAMQSIDDEFYYQLDQRAIELKREMNDIFIFGSPSASLTAAFPTTGAADNRTTAGLLYFLQQAGGATAGGTFDSTAEGLTAKVLNNMQFASAKLGGNPTLVVAGGKQTRLIEGFGADLVRIVPNERVRGAFSTLYRTDLGVVVTLVADLNMGNGAEGTVAFVDPTRFRLHPFIDAEMFVLVAPTFSDGDAARIICEWGLEVRNALVTLAAHSVHTALTIPS